MNEALIILGIIFIHWFADFVCQTDAMATGKSTSWEPLLEHTGTYSFIWLIISGIAAINVNQRWLLLFAPITFLFHTATDYYTSRVNKVLWEEKKVHQFFVSIGFDQFLHYAQLILTYELLK